MRPYEKCSIVCAVMSSSWVITEKGGGRELVSQPFYYFYFAFLTHLETKNASVLAIKMIYV